MHNTFLHEVAEQLYNRYGDDISSLVIVMPSQRARLFLSDALAEVAGKPIWQPRYMSMDELMGSATTLVAGNKMRIIAELYKIYSTFHDEPVDKFYFWGEMLLGDFDLVDKYMIDADMLFRNIYDLKVLESDLSYLTPEMRRIIHNFWSLFSEEAKLSDEKQKFLDIWLSLSTIYHRLHERLEELQFAYQGMIYRAAAENVESGKHTPDLSLHYVFVGFNALSACERRMLRYLATNAACDFCWDYDDYYVSSPDHEAGKFIRDNIFDHKPTLDITHDNFLSVKKNLSAISTVSNITQCKYIPTILSEISPTLNFDKDTAIVLTDETLLEPLLHSLPNDKLEKINVTMGFPLRQTTAYSFMERLVELQKNARHSADGASTFYHIDVMGLLSHPYVTSAEGDIAKALRKRISDGNMIRVKAEIFAESEMLQTIFTVAKTWEEIAEYLPAVLNLVLAKYADDDSFPALQTAQISLLAKSIAEVINTVKMCDIEISTSIFTTLLKRHLQTIRIPYSGEPLQGLQIMGILETRNIDFKNVIILSMNDDNFPGKMTGGNSVIPYNLRAAYGMPTPEHHEGVYAYYFYRLIQRAERVDMCYCSRADDKTTGEQSRYIYQLSYEAPYPVSRINVGVNVESAGDEDIVVEKNEAVMSRLGEYLKADSGRYLSPSALAPYVACPLRFYFSSIAKIRIAKEMEEDIDNPTFGTILHAAIQTLYEDLVGIDNIAEYLRRLLDGDKIERTVEQAINNEYLHNDKTDASEYSGNLLLANEMAVKYIRDGIIPYDIAHDNFSFMAFEKDIKGQMDIGDGRKVNIGGKADRIDSLKNGNIRVVDYKTGAVHNSFGGIEALFHDKERHQTGNILQTFIYSMILSHEQGRNVEPALYFVRKINSEEFSPRILDKSTKPPTEVDYATYAESFEQELGNTLRELFNPDVPFTQCDRSSDCCKYCDFKTICRR